MTAEQEMLESILTAMQSMVDEFAADARARGVSAEAINAELARVAPRHRAQAEQLVKLWCSPAHGLADAHGEAVPH